MNYVSFRLKALVYCEEHNATLIAEDDWGGLVYCKDNATGDVYGVSQEHVATYYRETREEVDGKDTTI